MCNEKVSKTLSQKNGTEKMQPSRGKGASEGDKE